MTLPRRPARGQSELIALQREISQLFGRVSELVVPGAASAEWLPATDVYESRGTLVIVLEAAGLGPESVRVVCRDNRLFITGERRERCPAGAGGFLCMERPHGRFLRIIELGLALDLRQAEARLAGGLLTISIPRLKDRRGRETVIAVLRE